MANTLARMERDGLIARTPDPDDRRSSRGQPHHARPRQRAEAALEAALETNELALRRAQAGRARRCSSTC